jgi:hypothetical protein
LAGLLSLSGCSSDAKKGSTRGLDYFVGDMDSLEVARTRFSKTESAVSVCMKTKGFVYVPEPATRVTSSPLGYTQASKNWHRSNAYGLTERLVSPPAPSENEHNLSTMTPSEAAAFQNALDGTDKSPGCRFTSVSKNGQRVRAAASSLKEEILKDPQTKDIDSSWSSCMKKAGFTLTSANQIYRDVTPILVELLQKSPTPPPLDSSSAVVGKMLSTEKSIARADGNCATDALIARYQKIVDRHNQKFISRNYDNLEAFRKEEGRQ